MSSKIPSPKGHCLKICPLGAAWYIEAFILFVQANFGHLQSWLLVQNLGSDHYFWGKWLFS
jgi:hypothetical protein